MTLKLYDTKTRSVRDFTPLDMTGKVGMYCCGPTVYNYAHIGNLRTYLFEDILQKTLRYNGYEVTHVMNITDVGHLTSDADEGADKVEESAKKSGKSAWQIAKYYEKCFFNDLVKLNIARPDIVCRATDHITEQLKDIKDMMENGFAYKTEDGIYFDTAKDNTYGELARLDKQGLDAGHRVRLKGKKNPNDFALWKFSEASEAVRQMEWDSPWGIGWPGWHIECSSMAVKYLGTYFDIHCGGKDHIPVHHINEIAQTKACKGTDLANFWLHGYFLEVDKKKLSKSDNTFITLQDVVDRGMDPLAFRFMCLHAHYRTDMNFSWEGLKQAEKTLNKLRRLYYGFPACPHGGLTHINYSEKFWEAIQTDLNTPKALSIMWELLNDAEVETYTKKATLDYFDCIFGLSLRDWVPPKVEIPSEIKRIAYQRQVFRDAELWHKSDQLRDELLSKGYEVEDTADSYIVKALKT